MLHFGHWKKTVEVKPQKDLNENSIGLPTHLASHLTIPEELPYDMYMEADHLYVGPVIGCIVSKGNFSRERLRSLQSFLLNYQNIKGLIYFCTVDGIDSTTKTIRGYYYNPNAAEKKRWKSGVFPYPGVIYRRTKRKLGILKGLLEDLQGKVFNAYIFNKWEMWKILTQAGFIHTPHTDRLNGLDSLKKMLSLHKSVYLKPVKGHFGIGILQVENTPNGYLLKDNAGMETWKDNPDGVYQLIQKRKRKGKYIIQQAVPLNYQNKRVDFRVILQKDGSQEWSCSGIIAKIGLEGHILTNHISELSLGREAIQMTLGLNNKQALKKENEIIRICTDACLRMEHVYGLYGDVGIDVVVDQNQKIWILEINIVHQHEIAMYQEDDPDMYTRVRKNPMEYAKALAGFNRF